MKSILDKVDDSIICFDQSQAILFFNRSTELFLGYHSDQLAGQDMSLLFRNNEEISTIHNLSNKKFKKIHQLKFLKHDGTQIDQSVFISSISLKHEKLWVIIIPHSPLKETLPIIQSKNKNQDNPASSSDELDMVQLHERFLQNQERIMMLEEALNSVVGSRRSLEKSDFLDADSNNQSVRDLNKNPSINEIRLSVVEVMQKSLECWETSTQKTKLELAKESQIWHVNMEDGCYEKTRTLDRYLNLKTLPKNPRIREVVRTANFVLEFSSSETHKIRLEAALMHLRSLSQEPII